MSSVLKDAFGTRDEALAAAAPATAPVLLEMRGVGAGYGDGADAHAVLHDVNLDIAQGEFVAILGFSGSGKTTLISLLAGLLAPTAGELRMRGELIDGPGPERGVVFQSYSLMPWMTVHDNVALAVDAIHGHRTRMERDGLVRRYVDLVNLSAAMHKRPAELSGGMRQRVAVARALSGEPDVLLLDEPLSALDALTRTKLQDEIIQIWDQHKRTVVLITNDVDEAVTMADRVIPLTTGPEATLGREFLIDLERPRDRQQLNDSARYKELRREITSYLMEIGNAREQAGADGRVISLPSAVPITSREHPKNADQAPLTDNQRERYVEFFEVAKVYPGREGPVKVVDGFEMKIRQGEFVSIIGHSGCGKSTVLSMLAGLTDVSEGGIVLDGTEVNSAGPDRGIVFQAPSLVPWLTASQNVALGVQQVYPHLSRHEHRDIIEYYLQRVGLADARDKRAVDLSNGMKQRVGIARAFALSPKVLLLDEPFGMLDSLTRWELQEVLMEVWSREKLTAIMVTHDVDEAILVADRICMMTNGPHARVGDIVEVDLPRPRTRRDLLAHGDYYRYRSAVLDFLSACDHTH